LAGFTGASALCGLSTGPGMLIAARAAQAVGAALLTPATLALILPYLIEVASRPVIFLINVPADAVAWWLGRANLIESKGSSPRRGRHGQTFPAVSF
jgi:MFS family permease